MQKIIRTVLLALIVGLGWLNYNSLQHLEASQQHLLKLNAELGELRQEVTQLQEQVAEMEKSSVKGIVEEANEAILTGWEVLIDTVQEEIKRAKEAAQEQSPSAEPPVKTEPDEDAPPPSPPVDSSSLPEGAEQT